MKISFWVDFKRGSSEFKCARRRKMASKMKKKKI